MISKKTAGQIEKSSWIRKMFEEGLALKRERGAENVCDFSLGNPVLAPPQEFYTALERLLSSKTPGCHGYMENLGWREVREKIALYVKNLWDLPFDFSHICLTSGAAGAISITLKTLLDPLDEVIIFAPFFPEYFYYIDSQGGKRVIVPCDSLFDPNLKALEKALSPVTKAVILNSPNNPTGRIYSEKILANLSEVLRQKSKEFGHAIYLLSDEPYRDLIYSDQAFPPPVQFYQNTISITSFSKTLSIPGERIGYLAIHPEMEDGKAFMDGIKLATRALGFVNAPSLMQRLVPHLLGVSVDVNYYRKNRDQLVKALQGAGYDFTIPQGGFYLFPRAPGGDDISFVNFLKNKYSLLSVPGSGFGCEGFFRICYSVPPETIERALPKFQQGVEEFASGCS